MHLDYPAEVRVQKLGARHPLSDVPLYNGTYGTWTSNGMTFWGTQYCLPNQPRLGRATVQLRNLVLTRGYVMGADYPVSNAQYGAAARAR